MDASIRTILSAASDRACLPLTANDLEPLACKIEFSLKLGLSKPTQLPTAMEWPPTVTAAVRKASDIRRMVGANDLDPLLALPTLVADRLGVLLYPIDHQQIAAASALIDDFSFLIVSTRDRTELLYACAKQLGHLLLLPHRLAKGVAAVLEPPGLTTSAPRGVYQRFADFFALELLVPGRGLAVSLKEIRKLLNVSNPAIGDIELLYAARLFGVSFAAMARRCERAGLLPKGGATVLHDYILAECGGPDTRAEQLGIPPIPVGVVVPVPHRVAAAIAAQVQKGQLLPNEVAEQLGWVPADLLQVLQRTN